MKLSFIIPCHDTEEYIENCLNSILFQKTKYKHEVIIVLDNCSQRMFDIVNNIYCPNNFDLKIYYGNYGSAGLARNEGLKHITGDYIWFVDSDDMLISPYCIQKLEKAFENNSIDILYFDFLVNGTYKRFNDNCGTCFPCVWNKIFKATAIKDHYFTDKLTGEDLEFVNSLSSSLSCAYLSVAMYYYNYPREGSLTATYNTELQKTD